MITNQKKANASTRLDKDDLMELYKLNVEQEHYFLTEHQNRVKFFVGILTTLIGATVYGIIKTGRTYPILMILGPMMIVIISIIAWKAVERLYQRFLEAIAQRAKLEYRLGMSDSEANLSGQWYEIEPLVNKRYLDDRIQGLDSSKFVTKRMNTFGSYHSFVTIMFEMITIIGLILCEMIFLI